MSGEHPKAGVESPLMEPLTSRIAVTAILIDEPIGSISLIV